MPISEEEVKKMRDEIESLKAGMVGLGSTGVKTFEDLERSLNGYQAAIDRNILGEEKVGETLRKKFELVKQFIERKIKLNDLEGNDYKLALERYEQYKKEIEQLDKLDAVEKRRIENLQGMAGVMKQYTDKIVGADNASTKFLVGLATLPVGLKNAQTAAEFTGAALQRFGTALINIGLIPFRQTYELMIEMNKELAARVRESSYAIENSFMVAMYKSSNSMALFGIVAKDIMKDFYALRDTSAVAYNQIANGNQAAGLAIAETSAKFTRLGVSAETTGKIIDTFTLSIQASGKSSSSINESLERFANTSIGLGIPLRKFAADFESSMSKLAAQGTKALDIFVDLERQSKKLGIEFNTLLGITEQFDTFEGAAQAAGKLNAILGGDYLNSIQMLNADEATRIKLIKESLDSTGRSFETLDKYSKKAIATSLGISDMNVANKLFSNSQSENSLSTQKLNDVLEKSASIGEKFDAMLKKLALTFEPLLTYIEKAVKGLDELFSVFADMSDGAKFWSSLGIIALGMGAVYLSFVLATKGLGMFIDRIFASSKSLSSMAGNLGEVGKAAEGGAGGMNKVGGAAAASWQSILAFGGAILLIGVGIAVAAVGLSFLVKAFGELTGGQILGALGALVIVMGGFILMIKALAAVSPEVFAAGTALYYFGGAVALVGLGIGLAAAGLALLVMSFSTLKDVNLINIGAGFIMIAAGLGILTAAAFYAPMALLGVVGTILILGLAFFGVEKYFKSFSDSANAINASLKDLASSSSAVTPLIQSLATLASLETSKIEGNFAKIASGLANINTEFGRMRENMDVMDKLNASTNIETGAARFITEIKGVEETKLKDVTGMLKAATDYNNSAKATAATGAKEMTDAATKLINAVLKSTGENRGEGQKEQIPIILKVKEATLADTLVDVMTKDARIVKILRG
jgi:hypothetical protein